MLEFIKEHFQTILIFLIAVVALYVAYQQHLTSRKKLKLAMFDRRLVIYDALKDFLVAFQRDLTIDFEQLQKALTLRLVAALDRVHEAYKPYLHFTRVK